jgi:hypothetical protein
VLGHRRAQVVAALAIGASMAVCPFGPGEAVDPIRAFGAPGTVRPPRQTRLLDARPPLLRRSDQSVAISICLPWLARNAGGHARTVGRIGGTTRAIAPGGDRVYAGIDSRVVVFAVAPDGTPTPIAETADLGGDVRAMALVSDTLLVVVAPSAVVAFDVTAPRTPVRRFTRVVAGEVRDVAAHGATGVIAVDGPGFAGLIVTTVTGDHRLQEVGRLAGIGPPVAVAVDPTTGGVVVAVRDGGLVAVSVEQPAQPRVTGAVTVGLPAGIVDVAADRAEAYVLGASGVVIVDLGHVAAPRVTTSVPIAGDLRGVATGRGYVFVADARDQMWWFRRPESRASSSPPTAGGFHALSWDPIAQRLWLGGPRVALVPVAVDQFDTPSAAGGAYASLHDAVAVAQGDTELYVVTNDPMGLAVVSTEGDLALRQVGFRRFEKADALQDDEVDIAAFGRYAFLLYYDSLTAMDATSPAAPQPRRVRAEPWARAMTVLGDHLYIARDGLQVIDARDPGDLPEVGAFLDRAGTGQAVAGEDRGAAGNRVYVAQKSVRQPLYPTDLWVFDVTRPASPQRIGVHQGIASAADMVAAGDRVYVAHAEAEPYGVWVYDTRDASHIGPAGTIATVGRPTHLATDGRRLFIAEVGIEDPFRGTIRGRNGVQVASIAPGEAAVTVFVPFAGPIGGITVRGNRVYVAARNLGLFALEVDADATGRPAPGGRQGVTDGTTARRP